MSPERIVIVTTSFPEQPGDPAGHFVATEALALAGAGHSVVVIAPGPDRTLDGVRVIGLGADAAFGWPGALSKLRAHPHRALLALAFVSRARRLIRTLDCDRVIAHWLVPAGWPVATAASAPLEVVAHGSDVRLLAELPASLRRLIAGRLVARQAHVRCVSEEIRAAVTAWAPALSTSVEPAPIDTRRAPDRARARRMLRLDTTCLIVIVGRLVRSKRVDVALRSAALVPKANVVVIGDGPEAAELAAEHPGVRFVGLVPRDQALTWIAAADLVLSASRSEGAPTVIREARALGVPVVSTAAGDLTRWMRSDRELWVVD
ncbi:MAG: glycosyltransferase family 4 protein [Polyangiaceae bacterium]|nr:glycosyltransferase family 4 protein [Polyangiaceae bacterium]